MKPKQKPKPSVNIENCNFTNNGPPLELLTAIQALAKAAEANALAVQKTADALGAVGRQAPMLQLGRLPE